MHFKRRNDITYKPDVAAKPGLPSKQENAVREYTRDGGCTRVEA